MMASKATKTPHFPSLMLNTASSMLQEFVALSTFVLMVLQAALSHSLLAGKLWSQTWPLVTLHVVVLPWMAGVPPRQWLAAMLITLPAYILVDWQVLQSTAPKAASTWQVLGQGKLWHLLHASLRVLAVHLAGCIAVYFPWGEMAEQLQAAASKSNGPNRGAGQAKQKEQHGPLQQQTSVCSSDRSESATAAMSATPHSLSSSMLLFVVDSFHLHERMQQACHTAGIQVAACLRHHWSHRCQALMCGGASSAGLASSDAAGLAAQLWVPWTYVSLYITSLLPCLVTVPPSGLSTLSNFLALAAAYCCGSTRQTEASAFKPSGTHTLSVPASPLVTPEANSSQQLSPTSHGRQGSVIQMAQALTDAKEDARVAKERCAAAELRAAQLENEAASLRGERAALTQARQALEKQQQELEQENRDLAAENDELGAALDEMEGVGREFHTDTPADAILSMTQELLAGVVPSRAKLLQIRRAVLHSEDIYQPTVLSLGTALHDLQIDHDVQRSLMQQLGHLDTTEESLEECLGSQDSSAVAPSRQTRAAGGDARSRRKPPRRDSVLVNFTDLRSALAVIAGQGREGVHPVLHTPAPTLRTRLSSGAAASVPVTQSPEVQTLQEPAALRQRRSSQPPLQAVSTLAEARTPASVPNSSQHESVATGHPAAVQSSTAALDDGSHVGDGEQVAQGGGSIQEVKSRRERRGSKLQQLLARFATNKDGKQRPAAARSATFCVPPTVQSAPDAEQQADEDDVTATRPFRAAKSFTTRSGVLHDVLDEATASDADVSDKAAASGAVMHSRAVACVSSSTAQGTEDHPQSICSAPAVPPQPHFSRSSARRASCVTFGDLPSLLGPRESSKSSTAISTNRQMALTHSQSASAAVRQLMRMPSNSSIPAAELTNELLHAALMQRADDEVGAGTAAVTTQGDMLGEGGICDELDQALSGSFAGAADPSGNVEQHQEASDTAPQTTAGLLPEHASSSISASSYEGVKRSRPVSRRASQVRLVPHYDGGAVTPQASSPMPAMPMSNLDGLLESFTTAPLGPMLLDEAEIILATADTAFQFDAFELSRVTGGRALSSLAFFLLQRSELISTFKLNPLKLVGFLGRIEAGYKDNPYHNAVHAADVLQTLHVTLRMSGMLPLYADNLTLLALYLAAVVHDYEHPGLSNDYLVGSADPLAIRYNDRAPLENHHLAAAFTMMRTPECNFLNGLNKSDYDKMRKVMIDIVLATDMKQHFSLVGQFNNIRRPAVRGSSSMNTIDIAPDVRLSLLGLPDHFTSVRRQDTVMESTTMLTGDISDVLARNTALSHPPMQPVEEAERLLSLQVAFKISDLGHIAEGRNVHLKWVSCLEEEFFRQGDKERSAGLPVSPLFDRTKPGVTKSQVGFFEFVVLPLFKPFASSFPGARPMLAGVLDNFKYWRGKQALDSDK